MDLLEVLKTSKSPAKEILSATIELIERSPVSYATGKVMVQFYQELIEKVGNGNSEANSAQKTDSK